MEPITVGIREFRENLASYLLESDTPVAITSHGGTIGYFIPARHKRCEAERTALKEAAAQLDALLAAKGLTEDQIVLDFNRWRSAKRRGSPLDLRLRARAPPLRTSRPAV